LTLLGSTPFHNPTGLGPEDARLAPDGGTLWVMDTAAGDVSGFSVNGSKPDRTSQFPDPRAGRRRPVGLVVN
jgi:DNA-binding beta-propeller fold protein YncE